ncbi:MAG: hypothetical protein NT155_00035 [Candidatus Staskawiczbacteria bacterium]|nr:hypothetical protein [Candidatus Staskawiczbacteria bacterium]
MVLGGGGGGGASASSGASSATSDSTTSSTSDSSSQATETPTPSSTPGVVAPTRAEVIVQIKQQLIALITQLIGILQQQFIQMGK